MIIDTFDNKSEAIISPIYDGEKIKCDACIVTFSNIIEKYVVEKYNAKKVAETKCASGITPIYTFEDGGKTFAFYKTHVGAPISAGLLEEAIVRLDTRNFLVFGSAGVLDSECNKKVIVPNFAYRDEGTSYHYAKAEDFIPIRNFGYVATILQKNNIPFTVGKTWTTDAFYRETKNNLKKRQKDGCISVDMECSALQAVANFRRVELYYFFMSGDVLDAPEWDEEGLHGANHNLSNFDIALLVAHGI